MMRKRLKHRATFNDRSRAQNASMEWIETDRDLGTRWVDLKPITGNTRLYADQYRNVISHEARMRYDADLFNTGSRLKSDWIVTYKTRRFRVLDYIRNNEYGRDATLLLEELA